MKTRLARTLSVGKIGSVGFYYTSQGSPCTMSPKTWMCVVCGFIYDEAKGRPEEGIPAGTAWVDVPPNWTCPECGARKEDFEMLAI